MTFNFSVSHTATVLSLPPLKIQSQVSNKHQLKTSVSFIYFYILSTRYKTLTQHYKPLSDGIMDLMSLLLLI